MLTENKLEMLLWVFIMSLVLFAVAYFSVINIFERMNALSDVKVSFTGVPFCELETSPQITCKELYIEKDDGFVIFDGKDCFINGSVTATCRRPTTLNNPGIRSAFEAGIIR